MNYEQIFQDAFAKAQVFSDYYTSTDNKVRPHREMSKDLCCGVWHAGCRAQLYTWEP